MTREEAIKILADLTDNLFLHTWEEQYKALHMAIEALHREEAEEKGYCHRILPSNVEIVVRCKDCKHYHKSEMYSYCDAINVKGRSPKKIDFCSYGERKGGGDE